MTKSNRTQFFSIPEAGQESLLRNRLEKIQTVQKY